MSIVRWAVSLKDMVTANINKSIKEDLGRTKKNVAM